MSETISDPYPLTNPNAPLGHPGHLNSTQQATLDSMRLELQKLGYTERLDDATLVSCTAGNFVFVLMDS